MARIYPDRPLGTTPSNAERKVFYALKDLLPDEYTVLHSVPVYLKADHGSKMQNGELDFLVIHPDKGMLVIEVKGGGITRDASSGKWSSTDAKDGVHPIKDPYEQGKKYAYAISNLAEREKTTRKFDYPFFHAVWFPDIDTSGAALGISDNLHMITLGKQDLAQTASSVPRVFRNCLGGGNDVPGEGGVEALRSFLSPSWTLSVKLGSSIEDERHNIVEATRSQYRVLSLLQRFQRALVSGPAGSGKTFLAIEKARRICSASPESRVLIACYNKSLSGLIKSHVVHDSRIDVFTFHKLCTSFCKDASIPIPSGHESGLDEFYDAELPDLLLEALCKVGSRYDAIIVDEGQDFDPSWWPILEQCLRDPGKGLFYIFYDNNQGIYEKRQDFPIMQEPFVLEENCRNTRKILELVNEFYEAETLPVPLGPEGRSPDLIKVEAPDLEVDTLHRVLKKLVKTEKVNCNDIVILTPHAESRSVLKSGIDVGGLKLSWDPHSRGEGIVLCSTIHSYKGLESPVVIVAEISTLPRGKSRALLYVAYSRANSHLVVLC
ncbi:nuclease-related domain-containing DEAD/DEAH box helicase [Geomonas agri]|uniref:nuclease-related domain-containing DEAD/DEAH box helicase n=1 Tax=Geomonas agri TaxID=2873702 RepID=UPI001CD79369|nr:NERD domain-containing protein [Geomonas agri]